MRQVVIPRPMANRILSQAQSNEEVEICGLIGGKSNCLKTLYPIKNIAGDPAHIFEMDPAKQIDAMRQMRENEEELAAIYHSHPSSPAQPSQIDIKQAAYPEALYLIVSLNTEGVLEMRGFTIIDKQVAEVELTVED
ncbi:MAG: M67 family metallopeptidase [Gammaproteobacteria bacterium]|nr:M67 family metallopeptidase [Gammaproteobacteria bacterium]